LLADASASVWPVAVSALFEAIVTRAYEPHGAFPPAMAPLACGCKGLPGALTPEAQRLFGHGALHPEHETLIELPRPLDALSIDA